MNKYLVNIGKNANKALGGKTNYKLKNKVLLKFSKLIKHLLEITISYFFFKL